MSRDPSERWGTVPLAERLRPRTFDEFVGHETLAGEDGVLRRAAAARSLRSFVLWGPPGVGKTALARLLARAAGLAFTSLSAVTSGVKEIRAAAAAAGDGSFMGERTGNGRVVFIDEIHRLNKAQQDALLPFVEDGTLVLIGSTTENPSFEVNAALLSRVQVYRLEPHVPAALGALIDRALGDDEAGFGAFKVTLDDEARSALLRLGDGDARTLLNALETAFLDARARTAVGASITIDRETIETAVQRRIARHDKSGDRHYDLASALIKSMRASDPDAACYWLGRMIDGGEDPGFIVRRLVIFASEDVGNADPQALTVAVSAERAISFIGMPEGGYALYQATAYLSTAPKSNATLRAMGAVNALLERGDRPVPLPLRNAPTSLMQKLGYGAGYVYPHDQPGHVAPGSCLPEGLEDAQVYVPSTFGFEREIRRRMEYWAARRRDLAGDRAAAADPERRTNR